MKGQFKFIRLLGFAAIILILHASSGAAQQGAASAAMSVRVGDESGAAMAEAKVTVLNVDRNQSYQPTSDTPGAYRFLFLPLGNYELKVERSGFASLIHKLTLSVGQDVDIPITMKVAAGTNSVSITAEDLPVIETSRSEVANTIDPEEIEILPMNGRNYVDLALLVPGVSKTNTGNNERFAETSAVPGTGISVTGQRNLGNSFVVDGLSANDDAADLAGTFFSPEVIREFQVITSGGIAEFGRASTGILNIATKSGTNTWRGKAYGFFRNHRMDGTNIFAPVDAATNTRIKTSLTQAQYGVTLGGPIQKNKTFLFSNFEREDLHKSGYITVSQANVNAINSTLSSIAFPISRIDTGAYPTGDKRTSFFSKADMNLSPSNRFSARYSYYNIDSPNARNAGALNAISRGTQVADTDHAISISEVMNVSATSVNEFRGQYTHSRFQAPGNDLIGPAVSISGVANLGASTSSPTTRNIDLVEIADTFSIQKKSHFLRLGVDFLNNNVLISFPGSIYGTYSFTTLANFQSGNYSTYGQAFGRVDWFQNNPNVGAFAQDEWKLHHNLTVNLGLRYDVEWLDAGIDTRKKNFSPRVGLAFSPGDRKTVVRAGFGLYYDRVPLRAVANALRGAGVDYKTVSLQRTQVGAPVFPNKLAAFPTGTLFNLSTIDTNIKNSYGIQTSLQVEREITQKVSVAAAYQNMRGVHIIMQRNLNVPTVSASVDPVNLGRPNPLYANISQYSGQGDSYYNGLTISVQDRANRWVSGRLSYTFAKAIDNTGNAFFSGPVDNFNLRGDRGLSDNDQRHRFTISGQISAPASMSTGLLRTIVTGFQLSPVYTFSTGYPFNVVTGGQTIQTTAARAGVGRNTGEGFQYSSLDVRLSRQFRAKERMSLEALVESFNVLNHVNLQFPNNTFGTGTTPLSAFGKATAANDPRQIQLGLRLSF